MVKRSTSLFNSFCRNVAYNEGHITGRLTSRIKIPVHPRRLLSRSIDMLCYSQFLSLPMRALFSLIVIQSRPLSSSAHDGQEYARSQTRKHWFREWDNHMTFGVVSFAPERSEGANDATRDTNKLYARQKLCDYHYYQYIRPTRTNLFHKGRMFNMKSSCGLQIPFTPALCRLARKKECFREGSLSFGHVQ